jgi:hypothetical protein
VDLFILELREPCRPPEFVLFAKEANLRAAFPEAVWQGQAKTAADWRATYTRRPISPADLAAMGNRVYENAYPEG